MKKVNKKEIKFINDILKPWDELNDLLTKPYAYEPGLLRTVQRNSIECTKFPAD